MELICRTRGGENARELYRIFLCAHPDEYNEFVNELTRQIHKNHDCAVFYKSDPWQAVDEELLCDFNLIIISASRSFLTEENVARDKELKAAKEHRLALLPILTDRNTDIEYSEYFGELQYLARFDMGGGSIGYEDKLALYLSERIIPTPLIDRITSAFAATLFLSYRKVDRVAAQKIIDLIHSTPAFESVAVWYDEYLTLGENFNSSIEAALDKSAIFLLAVTKRLVGEDNYVSLNEFPMAKSKNMPLIPILLEEVEANLLNKRFPDLPETISLDEGERVIEEIGRVLAEKGIKSTPHGSEHLIALAYFMGIYLEKNTDIALCIFKRCAKEGNTDSLSTLASVYSSGEAVKPDLPLAIKYQKKLLKIRKKEYLFTKMALSLKEYMKELAVLTRLYLKSGSFAKAMKCAATLARLGDACHIEDYKVSVFTELTDIYEFSRSEKCIRLAREFIPRCDYSTVAALMYKVLRLTAEEKRVALAEEYYDFLISHRQGYGVDETINAIVREYLPDRKDVHRKTSPQLTEIEELAEPILPESDEGELTAENLLYRDSEENPLNTKKAEDAHLSLSFINSISTPGTDYTADIRALFEWLGAALSIKLRRLSPKNNKGGLKKAEVYAQLISAKSRLFCAGDFELECADWIEAQSFPYENESEAKRLAALYECLFTSDCLTHADIADKLCELYSFLGEREPHNYLWIQKQASLQAARSGLYRSDSDYDGQMRAARTAYKLIKDYATVSLREDYHFDLGVEAFCLGEAYDSIGDAEQAREYYLEAISELTKLENGKGALSLRERIELGLIGAVKKGGADFEMLKYAEHAIEELEDEKEKADYLARHTLTRAELTIKYGDTEEGLFSALGAVEQYLSLYEKYGEEYLTRTATALCTVAECIYPCKAVEGEVTDFINMARSLLDRDEHPTYKSDIIRARLDCLCGWRLIGKEKYSDALAPLINAEQMLFRIKGVKESAEVNAYLRNALLGAMRVHKILGNKAELRAYMKKVFKLTARVTSNDLAVSLVDSVF